MSQQPLEDIYPATQTQEDILSRSGKGPITQSLSPMQQGLLFLTLSASQPGIYIQQMVCSLHESLDVPLFLRAWQAVIKRHAALRTALEWEEHEKPMQVV